MATRRWATVLVCVLVLVAMGVGVACLLRVAPAMVLGKSSSYSPPLVIEVEARYPGANAQQVAEAVAKEVEERVNGVEKMLSMSSVCGNDGRYVLQVMFPEGTDPTAAQKQVQSRTWLAVPALPAVMQRSGLTVRKVPLQPIALVTCTAPGDEHADFLSNFATIILRRELLRVPGVAEVDVLGVGDPQMRITVDPDRLRAYRFSAKDLTHILSSPGCGLVGQAPAPDPNAPPPKPEDFENIILKATEDGEILRLKDVARVELASKASGATVDGRPSVVMALYPFPDVRLCDVSRVISEKLPNLRTQGPDDLVIDVAFDFAPNMDPRSCPIRSAHLVIDAEFPSAASSPKSVMSLSRAADEVRSSPGVDKVVTLRQNPFALNRNQPCLVVLLSPGAEDHGAQQKLVGELRSRLQKIPDAAFRISMPSAEGGLPVYGFPIEFIVEDRGDQGQDLLLQQARLLVERLDSLGKFTDAGVSLRMEQTSSIDIDREGCKAVGVDADEVSEMAQLALGSSAVNSINAFGRTWEVHVVADAQTRDLAAQLMALHVKNQDGLMIPLALVAKLSETKTPTAVERHNMHPAARITANLADGVGLQEAKKLCEAVAAKELLPSFKIVWANPAQK